jgi:hypothetical protein
MRPRAPATGITNAIGEAQTRAPATARPTSVSSFQKEIGFFVSFPLRDFVTMTYGYRTSRGWALFEKTPIVQPLEQSRNFMQNQRFITVLTRARQWSPSKVRAIQSVTAHQFSQSAILILFVHLCLRFPGDLNTFSFPTNILYTFISFPTHSTYLSNIILIM